MLVCPCVWTETTKAITHWLNPFSPRRQTRRLEAAHAEMSRYRTNMLSEDSDTKVMSKAVSEITALRLISGQWLISPHSDMSDIHHWLKKSSQIVAWYCTTFIFIWKEGSKAAQVPMAANSWTKPRLCFHFPCPRSDFLFPQQAGR